MTELPEIRWHPVSCPGCLDYGILFSVELHGVPRDIPCPCQTEGTIAYLWSKLTPEERERFLGEQNEYNYWRGMAGEEIANALGQEG